VRHLLSKIVAGGLSAAVILLWWPLVFPSDTVESWLVRGVLWTLCFELMLHAFAPLEESLWRSRAARRVAEQAQAAGARLGTDSERKRHHGRLVVAALALTVPLALLATAPAHRLSPKPAAAAAPVRHVTQVKRVVRVERRTVTVPRASAGGPAGIAAQGPTTAGSSGLRSSRPRSLGRRPGSRAAAPRRSPRGSSRSGDTGSRSGSPSPGNTTAEPTTGTPSTGTSVGSGERAAASPSVQPRKLVLAAL
jgi:hypothetical protein